MLAYQLHGARSFQEFEASIHVKAAGKKPPMYDTLKKLKHNKIVIKYQGQSEGKSRYQGTHLKLTESGGARKEYVIKDFVAQNAKTHIFKVKDSKTGNEHHVSVYDYYQEKYKVRIQHWRFPLVETQKKDTLFPMEFCWMLEGNRYPYKLNQDQVGFT